ncbi:unnamed protein product [Cuscuta campestris]|uniref:Uncharacterized protein n=1 Tax=Cuscuta campestris TaxID=132261 RepID=A0A484LAS1_9ASTE|nr:unnamed protein product [Cuscuta campestris]
MFSSLLVSVSKFAAGSSTPPNIHLLLQFDGEWDGNGVFSYAYAYEIDIPIQTHYEDFLELVRTTVPSSYENSVFYISYMSNSSSRCVVIEDDVSLLAYLRLKSTYPSLREFPLCVEVYHFKEMGVSNGESVPTEGLQTLPGYDCEVDSTTQEETDSDGSMRDVLGNETTICRDDISSRCDLSKESFTYNVDEISTHNDHDRELVSWNSIDSNPSGYEMSQQDINSLKEMHVTSQFDPTRIVVGAIYFSKMDLDYHLKMLAISDCFQYRTRTSKKSELHVVCVDFPRCQWAVRAVRLPGVEMFQVLSLSSYRFHQVFVERRFPHVVVAGFGLGLVGRAEQEGRAERRAGQQDEWSSEPSRRDERSAEPGSRTSGALSRAGGTSPMSALVLAWGYSPSEAPHSPGSVASSSGARGSRKHCGWSARGPTRSLTDRRRRLEFPTNGCGTSLLPSGGPS